MPERDLAERLYLRQLNRHALDHLALAVDCQLAHLPLRCRLDGGKARSYPPPSTRSKAGP